MKKFDALVLSHYDFTNDRGKHYSGTKYLVSLGQYGSIEANGPAESTLDVLSEVKVELTYKDNKLRVINVIK